MTMPIDEAELRRKFAVRTALQRGIVSNILAERRAQEGYKAGGRFKFTCADNDPSFPMTAKLAVLVEEVGEVARDVLEHDEKDELSRHLYDELIQCAAVCVAWCESILERESFDLEAINDTLT